MSVELNHVFGELRAMRGLLGEIAEAVVRPFGEIADLRGSSWVAGGVDDVDLGAVFAGVFLYNQEAFDAYVGFGPGAGTLARKALTLGAGAALSLPYRCSLVSVGAASASTSAGGVLVAPLLTTGAAGGGVIG